MTIGQAAVSPLEPHVTNSITRGLYEGLRETLSFITIFEAVNMSNRRVKSLAYDDEELDYDDDDNYDEEPVTAEDEEQMRQGIIKVREALGPSLRSVDEEEIRDVLWNKWYDVAKTVSEIKSS